MCEPVSAAVGAMAMMATMGMNSMRDEPMMPPPYVPPPPPPAPPKIGTGLIPEQAGTLSLGTKSLHDTKHKAKMRKQRFMPPSALTGLNIPGGS